MEYAMAFIVMVYVGLIIGVYTFFFFDRNISDQTSDWGSFGSYIGGLFTFVSVILLYNTLLEQRKENHRNWFDAGFNRRIHLLGRLYEENKVSLQDLSSRISQECHQSPFDNDCDYEEAKIELSNLYVNNQEGGENYAECLCQYFKSTVFYITSDKFLNNKIKEIYLNELEQSLPQTFTNVILCVMCYLNEDDTIGQLRKYSTFLHFQSGNAGIDTLKDDIFSFRKDNDNNFFKSK